MKKACQTNVSSDSGHASDGCKAKVVILNDDDAVTDALPSTPIHKNVGGNGNDCTVTPINNVDKSDKSPADCKISYKIGDLGHVASLDSE